MKEKYNDDLPIFLFKYTRFLKDLFICKIIKKKKVLKYVCDI